MIKRDGSSGFNARVASFLVEMDQGNPIQVVVEDSTVAIEHESFEIPDAYLENPPPETLSSLDEQLTNVLRVLKLVVGRYQKVG
jgi:hypothetical protein